MDDNKIWLENTAKEEFALTNEGLIKIIETSQIDYCSSKDKKYLKANSQFFTPAGIVSKMVNTVEYSLFTELDTIKILDPAAGCGILLAQLIFKLIDSTEIRDIEIVCYEIEKELSDLLDNNLSLLKNHVSNEARVNYKIYNKNFIVENQAKWDNNKGEGSFNLIISNPPFNKINQASEESVVMKGVVFGQPNIYGLFIAMSLKLLAPNGVCVVLSPRNYLTGEYSKLIRKYIFESYSLIHIHTFDKRNIFKFVNQEIIISAYKNNCKQGKVKISHNGGFQLSTELAELVYDINNHSLIIPTNNQALKNFSKLNALEKTLYDLGFKVSVGPIVQFRNKEYLSTKVYSDKYAPLLIGNDIQPDNVINYNQRKNNPKRRTHNKSVNIKSRQLIKNSNYLLIRKVTAKGDKDIIVTSILSSNYFDHKYLGIDNNLLYISKCDQNEIISDNELYGLYCYFNSTLFQEYYELINGTHTINVSDFSNIKLPSIKGIVEMGRKILESADYSKINCTKIFSSFLKEEGVM